MPVDVTNKRIYVDAENNKGITLIDIMRGLGYYKRDKNGNRNLGMIIRYADINKWSFKKPVRHTTHAPITDEQVKSVKSGLAPVTVSKILASTIGVEAFVAHTHDEGLAEVAEWPYYRPRGEAYNEPLRSRDFDQYNGRSVAPDSGWTQKDIDASTLTKMKAVTIDVTSTGDYTGYNFKMQPQYNGSDYNEVLYQSFSMKFGPESGAGIGTTTNMDIPISYIASLDGYYRIALAVWIPNFGESGGWGIFASRMTIKQYYDENLGVGDSLRNLLPDLATNPFVASLMYDYVNSNTGYASFNVVPLLIKDLGYTFINNVFCLRPVTDVTEAYCMPSGARSMSFICGTPPMKIWYKTSTRNVGNSIGVFIKNEDTEASHTFGYYITHYTPNAEPTQSAVNTITLAAGEERQVGGSPSQAGYSVTVTVVSQDGVEI